MKELSITSAVWGRTGLLTLLYKWGRRKCTQCPDAHKAREPGLWTPCSELGARQQLSWPPGFPLSTGLVEIRVLLDFQCLWKWCCDWLHGETLSHTPLLPASRRASAEVHLSTAPGSSAACPASSSHPVGTMGSSSITSHGTDLLIYSRGKVTLLFSSYEIIASFSLWVNRGVEAINPSTGNKDYLKKVEEKEVSSTVSRKERTDVIASAQVASNCCKLNSYRQPIPKSDISCIFQARLWHFA